MQISGLIENYNECPYTISTIKKECVPQESLHCRNILRVTYICKYLFNFINGLHSSTFTSFLVRTLDRAPYM